MKRVALAVLTLILFLSLFPADAVAKHKPKPPKPNSAGNWTNGSKQGFLSACKAFHQTEAMCTCSLNKVSSQYSVKDFINKLVFPTVRKRHLVPPAKSIFDSCGGRWDSLFKNKN